MLVKNKHEKMPNNNLCPAFLPALEVGVIVFPSYLKTQKCKYAKDKTLEFQIWNQSREVLIQFCCIL